MGRWGGGSEHEHFHPTLANRRRIRLSLRLISSHGIPSRGHTCRPVSPPHPRHTRTRTSHTRIRTFVWPRSTRQAPGEAISSIYRQRLHGSFAEPFPPSLPPSLVVPGFRRVRHFTYAARCSRANISGANITLHSTLYGYPCCGFQPELVLSSPVYRIPRVFDTHPGWQPSAPAPLNRKAAC